MPTARMQKRYAECRRNRVRPEKETLAKLPQQEQKAVKEQIHAQQAEYRQLKKLRWSLLTISLRNVSQAASVWNAWFDAAKESGIPALIHFASLKEKRLPGLVAHAIFPISTGKPEGFNSEVKVAQCISYGYRNNAYFFTLVRFFTWLA